jgi:tetratricopeptide (TPR) repeat protein
MSNSYLAAVAAAVFTLGGMTMSVAEAQVPTPKVSLDHAKAFTAMGEAFAAKRYGEVDTQAKAVLASAKKTRDDVFAAHQYLMQTAQARNDVAGQMKALEGQLESGFLPASARNSYYRNLIGLAYKVPDYRKAIEYGQQSIKSGDTSPDVYQWVGQAFYELKDYKSAVGFFSGLVGDKEKAGRRPDRNELILLQSSYAKAGDPAAAEATLKKVVKYYPDPDTWALLIHNIKSARLDFGQKLHLYRLLNATGNLKQAQDYMAYSDAAIAMGLHAESQKVLDAGLKANVFPAGADRSRAERYQKSAAAQIAAMKQTMAKLEAEAKAAPTGDKYVALGMAYYNFGQYSEAANALKAGIAKGGLKNPADARLNLGVTLLKAGQKGEALKEFRAAKSDDEVTQRMAELWALYSS